MTFAEAFAKLCELAPGYCSLKVEASRNSDGTIEVVWQTYDTKRSPGWSDEYPTAEEALANDRPRPLSQTVDGIDPIPEGTCS